MVEAAFCDGGGGPGLFPVVFFDGECESTIGNVVINPATDFKDFQLMISRRIGISPHQFSVYIADINNPSKRVPVTGKLNFSVVSREKDCLFLVALKISQRSRARRGRKAATSHPTASMKKEPPANALLLRRGDGNDLDEIERRERYLNMEKERYLVNLGRIAGESKGLVCEECENAEDVGFHWCVYDVVTFGFRSHAGPISRPGNGSGC